MKQNFRFYTDSISITKAKDKDGKEVMRLGGIASTRDQDSDGEFLDPTGFDVSYLKNEGIVNWHHGAKTNPEAIIGEPSKVEINNKGLYIEVDLYPESKMARDVYKLAQVLEKNSSSRRLGFSIEGKALERDKLNKKIIKKAAITGVAVTHMPKNPNTFAQIIKGDVDEVELTENVELEEINKSLREELNSAKIALADEIIKSCTSKIELSEDDEEDEEDEEKALSTGSSSGKAVMPAHVDGQEKVLTKGQIYTKIFDVFGDIDIRKARKIEQIIKQATKMSGKTAPTDKELQKALEVLGFTEDNLTIEKCIQIGNDLIEDGKTLEDVEKALLREGAEDDMILKALEEIRKGSDEESEEDEDDDVKKGSNTVHGTALVNSKDGGADEDEEAEEGEDEGNEGDEESEEDEEKMDKGKKSIKKSWKSDGDVMFLKKGEHYEKFLKKGRELVKADDCMYMKKGAMYKKVEQKLEKGAPEGDIMKALESMSSRNDEIAKAMGSLLSQTLKDNESLMGQLDQLTERVSELEKGGAPGRKSFPSARHVERTFGKEVLEGNDLEKGEGTTLSVTRDKQKVLNLLEKAAFANVEKGGNIDSAFEKAISVFEVSGMITGDIAKRVKSDYNVTLVR